MASHEWVPGRDTHGTPVCNVAEVVGGSCTHAVRFCSDILHNMVAEGHATNGKHVRGAPQTPLTREPLLARLTTKQCAKCWYGPDQLAEWGDGVGARFSRMIKELYECKYDPKNEQFREEDRTSR